MEWNNGKMAEQLLQQACAMGASDVHIEPHEREAHIRVRIDGLLQELCVLPRSAYQQLVTQLKVAGGMDIAEKRLPQDGRLAYAAEGRQLDVRLSTLPTINGEKAALRLLGSTAVQLRLEELSFTAENQAFYTKACHAPHGLVLVTGPTGSGKTTTLYATLGELDSRRQNIVTVEDPVEYKLDGINQVAVNRKAGLDFASGLRSILRQDPDIIMVGEIRDSETAEMALRAALTGHLVFSTLHTNSAVGAVSRLLDMGVAPYLLASTLRCVLAQRLVRRICPQCAEQYTATALEQQYLASNVPNANDGLNVPDTPATTDDNLHLHHGVGCNHCHGTGYHGRIAVQELMVVDDELAQLINSGADAAKMTQHCRAHGCNSLAADGAGKVRAGLTTVQELWRVGLGRDA